MRILSSVVYRVARLLGAEATGRNDIIQLRHVKLWIRQQNKCVIESDLQIRGHRQALEYLKLGAHCAIDKGGIIWVASAPDSDPAIILGDRVYIGPYCFLGSDCSLSIGDETIIGAFSYIITASHRAEPGLPVRDQGYQSAPIRIGRDVWIGCHVVILPGVTIGDHAVIGAGAVVNRDVPAGEKWAGVPARKIGMRVTD